MGGFADRKRMGKSGALLQGSGGDIEPVHGNGVADIGEHMRSVGRHGVQNDVSRLLASELYDASCCADGTQIKDAGAARDQDEISGLGRRQSYIPGLWGAVDDGKVGPCAPRRIKRL